MCQEDEWRNLTDCFPFRKWQKLCVANDATRCWFYCTFFDAGLFHNRIHLRFEIVAFDEDMILCRFSFYYSAVASYDYPAFICGDFHYLCVINPVEEKRIVSEKSQTLCERAQHTIRDKPRFLFFLFVFSHIFAFPIISYYFSGIDNSKMFVIPRDTSTGDDAESSF
jgi:hypothetical protein